MLQELPRPTAPSGYAAETAWDVFNVITGAVTLGQNLAAGNYLGAVVDGVGVLLDSAAVVIPFVPAGASVSIKAFRAADKGVDAIRAVDKAADGARTTGALVDTARTAGPAKNVLNTAEGVADAALGAGRKSGGAAELRVGDKVYTGVSGEVVKPNGTVTGVLMGNKGRRADWHGGCAEIVCLDKALNDGIDVAGGKLKSVNIGNRYAPHKSPKKLCDSCKDAASVLGVGY